MPDDFEEFVKELQEEIIKKAIVDHNERIVSLYYNPQNWGKPPEDEINVSVEHRSSPKGYSLGLYLNIKEDKIIKAHFITDGCGVMVATGSQITLLIEGKSLEYAESLKPEDIDEALLGLPENEKHCADLAIETLKAAINKYKNK